MNKDATKPPERTPQGRKCGQANVQAPADAAARFVIQPVPVHARALLAQERARTLRAHFEFLERELENRMAEWCTLPIEEFPLDANRLHWLKEQTEPLVERVNRSWDDFYAGVPGSGDPETRTRMRLLESLDEVIVQRDTWVVRSVLARRALGRRRPGDDERLCSAGPEARRRGKGAAAQDTLLHSWATIADWEPPDILHVAMAARVLFNAQYPNHGRRLEQRDWVEALAAFQRGRGERSRGGEKWEILARFVTKAGCTRRGSTNLKKDWRLWKMGSLYPTLFPILNQEQDELQHGERSRSSLNTTSGIRSKQP